MNIPTKLLLCPLRALCLAAALSAAALHAQAGGDASVTAGLSPDGGRIVVEARGVPAPVPLFFSATATEAIHLGASSIEEEMHIHLHVLQGKPTVLTLGLSGDGEVKEVLGAGLGDWSVRRPAGADGGTRLLDITPVAGGPAPADYDLVLRGRLDKPEVPGTSALLLLARGDAVGFSSTVDLDAGPEVDMSVTSVSGLVAVGDALPGAGAMRYYSTGDGEFEARLVRRGAATAEAELSGTRLQGTLLAAGGSVDFHVTGQLRSGKAGSRLRLLSGRAALSGAAAGDGWHVELVADGETRFAYDLVGDREGLLAVDIPFSAKVGRDGDWRSLDFTMPAGAVVPMHLDGLGAEATFNPKARIVPVAAKSGWDGYLPSDGSAAMSWKLSRSAQQGVLSFTSSEQTDVRVGAGLLRESARLSLRVLQGKLAALRCRMEGPGEVLGVEGTNVVGWKVVPDAAGRVLEVSLSRPIESEGVVTVNSQAELGAFPVKAETLRLVPEGVVRHSGYLRVANSGSVRLEVTDIAGMMQLAPAQFPGGPLERSRQVFVYRFPSGAYAYRVAASEIAPEVGVSEVATYEFSESDRVIDDSIELDVREAPLRDWTVQVPGDYTVASVEGAAVADYVAESATVGGYRALKVVFSEAVEGRQLLRVRLEKNQPAAPGGWRLSPLRFPGAKSVRGNIGVVSSPGYRLVPALVEQLAEVPVSYFPRQTPGLQQAWRLRDAAWAADIRVEALGQSIQADVFHLYSVKEGIVYASVLLNYFVVGAPATEWRVEVPPTVGNIDVAGQNVQREWRREGNEVIVSLHQPVLGSSTLLVTFEQPMSARGGVIEPGQVRPLGVQSERGYIEVVSPLQVKFDVRRSEGGLLKIEPLELPAEFRLLSSSPALTVYQYTARPFRLEVGLEWYAQAETTDQVVDFAKLASQVSRDGQVITDARYYVKTHGRKALRLLVPPSMKLWETRVDNEVTSAQVDGSATLVPLPARANPNEPVLVELRLGQAAGPSGEIVELVAPRAESSAVVTEWTLTGDTGRVLVPKGGTSSLVSPALTETGFEWISSRGVYLVASLLAVVCLGALLMRTQSQLRLAAGLVCCLAAMVASSILAADALTNRRANLHELSYASAMVGPSEEISIRVANQGEWSALIVGWGVVAAACGVALAAAAPFLRRPVLPLLAVPAAAVLVSAGLLAQHGGAVAFFAALCAAVFVRMFIPGANRWERNRRALGAAPSPAGSPVLPLLLIAGALGLSPSLRAEGSCDWIQAGSRPAQSMVETWSIRDGRVYADVDVTVRGVVGDSFLLLRPPAVLSEFKGDGLRVGKVERDGETSYFVAPERNGVLAAHARFEMPAEDASKGIAVPTGPAATQQVSVEMDQGGWDFACAMAVKILPTPGLGEAHSGATLVLAPQGRASILLRPRRRDAASETTQFFAEAANLFVPGPGVVDCVSRISVRPVQGRVSDLDIEIPKGFTVGDVTRGPVGAWRFDPRSQVLHVTIEPAQAAPFRFDVQAQHGAGALPFGVSLQPLHVTGAAGQVGTLALAFGSEAQPESVVPEGMSQVSSQDFDADLVPKGADARALAVVQEVWHYGAAGGRVGLQVTAVAPEVRVASRQVVSLDDDRLVMADDLSVSIARAGIFSLSFTMPEGLEVEALSGPALSQWTEATEGGSRIVTLHLNGRTMGDQAFSITLSGPAPRAQAAWQVPRLVVREAARQTGEILVVPGKGLRLRVADRAKATQIDPAAAGGLQPGTLAFRLLQADWALSLGIEALEPWVTVQSLNEVTVREGQTLTRIGLRYRVENAASKQFRIRLPGLGDSGGATVRATGSAVSDIVAVPGSADLWDVHFQRGIAGETDVQVEYQRTAPRASDSETVTPPEFPGARQVEQYVAVRGGGRLELDAGNPPRGWVKADWAAVAANLQSRSDRTVPALCYRVAEPEGPLAVSVRRHDIAEELKLHVTQADLSTVFSPTGSSLTSMDLNVGVAEKSTLSVRLPEGARLFSTFVNGVSAAVVREGDAYLFHVAANADTDSSAEVRLAYSVQGAGNGEVVLSGPSLSVPLENVAWRVALPPGYALTRYKGGLQLLGEHFAGPFGIDQYRTLVETRRSSDARKAVNLLEEANSFLQSGDQQRAGEMLSRASDAQLDEASNEDARVQLRILKTQQTLLGLNTRRQRVYLDNRADASRNEPLEQAASLNPFMRGKLNFDPQQVDQLLMGNTAEENSALRGIASRLVDQQLAAEPAPGAIDVTLPERGTVLTFTRSLQIDGGSPLVLDLTVARSSRTNIGFSLAAMFAVAAISMISHRRKA